MVLGKVKESLMKSEDATRKQQAQGWRVYKASEPGPNGSVLDLLRHRSSRQGRRLHDWQDPVGRIPAEVQTLYKQFADSYAGGQAPFNLTPVLNFAQ